MIKSLMKFVLVVMIVLCALPLSAQTINNVRNLSDAGLPATITRVQSVVSEYIEGSITAVLPIKPVQGNLIVVTSMHRMDGYIPHISGTRWNLEIERYSSIANGIYGTPDNNFRCGMVMWWKVAGVNEPQSIIIGWTPSSRHRVFIQEFSAGSADVVWRILDRASNNTNSTSVPNSLSLSNSEILRDDSILAIATIGWRTGSASTYPTDISYSNDFVDPIHYYDESANNIAFSSSFIHNNTGGARDTVITWAGDGHISMGGMLIFVVRIPPDKISTYWYTSDKTFTAGWNKPSDYIDGDMYEVKIRWVETGQDFIIGETEGFEMDIKPPRTGHFDVYVRVKRIVTNAAEEEYVRYSHWAISSNYLSAVVDGVNEGWRVYCIMAPPGEVIIF